MRLQMGLHWSVCALLLGAVPTTACQKKDGAATTTRADAPAAAAAQAIDPCKLLTAEEVKEVLGQDVVGPTPNKLNASVCDFRVAAGGSLNVTAKVASSQETIDAMMAALKKRDIAVSEKTFPAESFFASPGYGMVQLNSFQAGKYAIITALVPGKAEPRLQEMLQKLMPKALARL
jgi:hypothetical protein